MRAKPKMEVRHKSRIVMKILNLLKIEQQVQKFHSYNVRDCKLVHFS